MKRHLTIAITLTLMGLIVSTAMSRHSVDAWQDNRAQEVLAAARAALGGDAKLKAVQSITLNAKFRKTLTKDRPEISGELQLDFLLPDKYMSTEASNMPIGDAQIIRISGFNGDQGFADARTSGHGATVIVLRGSPDNPEARAAQLRTARAEFARHLISWLLTVPPNQSTEVSYAGEAESEDGRADLVDVKGADDFAVRLFLDKQTHRPLMISYRGALPNMVMRMETGSGPGPADPQAAAREAQERARKELGNKPAEPRMAEMQVYLSDYRAVEGVLLPHHFARAVNGEVNEEWEVTKFRINPPLKAENFKK